jgi:uncharacterized protein YceK
MKTLTILLLILGSLSLTGCGSVAKHMAKLEPMVGSYTFAGVSYVEKRAKISGTTTHCFSPDGTALLIHFEQKENAPDEGFGVITWDKAAKGYRMSWESTGEPGRQLTSTGKFDANGRLVLKGAAPPAKSAPKEGYEKVWAPDEHVYTFSFPETGKIVFTIKTPVVDRKTFYEVLRFMAQKKSEPPDRETFEAQFNARREAVSKKP